MTRNKKRFSNVMYIAIIIIAVLIFVLYILDNKESFSRNSVVRIEIEDTCSLVLNNMLHYIKSEGNCESLCKNECSTQGLNYDHIEFTLETAACNECICYCI